MLIMQRLPVFLFPQYPQTLAFNKNATSSAAEDCTMAFDVDHSTETCIGDIGFAYINIAHMVYLPMFAHIILEPILH